MHQEWIKILRCTSFGGPFHQWLASQPECGMPPWPLPTSAWLFDALQLAQHVTNAAVAQDHLIFKKKSKFARHADRKFQGSSQAFGALKQAPALPITEVYVPQQAECLLIWDTDACEVQCICENAEDFNPLSPVKIGDAVAWIFARDEFSFTARFRQVPSEMPDQACVSQDNYVVEPHQVVDQLNSFWKPLWLKEHDQSAETAWPAFDNLLHSLPSPPHQFQHDNSLTAWKKAIAKMKAKSARGFDAISAQELKLCPDPFIKMLIQVCDNYPQGFPQWMMCARVCPLSKASSGIPLASQSRPICILSQLYRLFSAVWCTQVLSYWNIWFPPQICGMLPTRGSHDAGYMAQTALELAHYQQQPLAGVTLDIVKCFNCIRHACAPKLLIALGLPPARVWQWFWSITKLQRYWEVAGQTCGPLPSTCGFPEGDSHSVLVMLSIALLWVATLNTATRGQVSATAYADNWTWASSHQPAQGIAAQTTLEVTAICGLDIDFRKTWLWSTDTPTANAALEAMQAHLPADGLQRLHNAKDLGFQMHYSGCRVLGSRQQRFDEGLKRLERLSFLHHDLATKEHLVLSSVFPTAFYGAETFPVSDEMLMKMRSATAEALVGRSKTMSPALVLLLTKNAILDPEFYVLAQALRTVMQWLPTQTQAIQNLFFAAAASFTGQNRHTRGPASTLKHLMNKISWTIDAQGYVHVDGLLKLHLLRDGFPRMRHFLTLAWQQNLVLMHTARHSLYSLPDISRADTVAVLKRFSDTQRRHLLKEIAGAFQLETQKAHWAEDATGKCPFCDLEDSKEHRLSTCPAFAEDREPFQQALQQIENEGLEFAMCPCITVHPETYFHDLLHHQQPQPIIHSDFHTFANNRCNAQQPFHMYVDGSCLYPSSATTRIAAYAGILDIAANDAHRMAQADRFLATRHMPETLVTLFASRLQGEQNINRAELAAMTAAATLPFGDIHSDSTYAIAKAHGLAAGNLKLYAMSNADLLHDLRALHLNPQRIHKIKAHQDPADCQTLLEVYHMLGNRMADEAAKVACTTLDKPWFDDLVARHKQVANERNLLEEVYNLHLALAKARDKMEEQLHRQEVPAVPPAAKPAVDPILPKIQTWMPIDCQVLTFPDTTDSLKWFSWGDSLARSLLEWMKLLTWPTQPQGPLDKELGVSWLELGISFSMYIHKALPVLRTNADHDVRLLLIEDEQDIANYAVTHQDVAGMFQRMWAQAQALLPAAAFPSCQKGLQSSLYVQGMKAFTSGLSLRPNFVHQSEVALYLKDRIQNTTCYDGVFSASWTSPRTGPLVDLSWKDKQNQLKYRNRCARARR